MRAQRSARGAGKPLLIHRVRSFLPQLPGFLQTKGLGKTQRAPAFSVGDARVRFLLRSQGLASTKGWKPLVEAGVARPGLPVLQLAGPSRSCSFPGRFRRLPSPSKAGLGWVPGMPISRVNTHFMEAEPESPGELVGECTEVCARVCPARAPSTAPTAFGSNDRFQRVKLKLSRSLSTHPSTFGLMASCFYGASGKGKNSPILHLPLPIRLLRASRC